MASASAEGGEWDEEGLRGKDPGKGELSLEDGAWKEQTQGRHPPGEAVC